MYRCSISIDRHPDRTEINFSLQIKGKESSFHVSVLFIEGFRHSNISFFHLLVNGFCFTSFHTFLY